MSHISRISPVSSLCHFVSLRRSDTHHPYHVCRYSAGTSNLCLPQDQLDAGGIKHRCRSKLLKVLFVNIFILKKEVLIYM